MPPRLKRTYVIVTIIAVLVFASFAMFGAGISTSRPGSLLIVCAIFLAYIGVLMTVRNKFAARATGEVQQMIDYFEQECNPQKFLEASDEYSASLKRPYDIIGSWFMSYRIRALAEAGRTDEAAELFNYLREEIGTIENLQAKASFIVNLVPSMRLMLGGRYALEALEEADALYDEAGVEPDSPRRAYARWERGNLEAQRDGNLQALATSMRQSANNGRNSWLVRVECAEREAWAHQAVGNYAAERERLQFVVEHGGKLSCVGRANARLAQIAELEAQGVPLVPAPAEEAAAEAPASEAPAAPANGEPEVLGVEVNLPEAGAGEQAVAGEVVRAEGITAVIADEPAAEALAPEEPAADETPRA